MFFGYLKEKKMKLLASVLVENISEIKATTFTTNNNNETPVKPFKKKVVHYTLVKNKTSFLTRQNVPFKTLKITIDIIFGRVFDERVYINLYAKKLKI